jgi:hypothetical protein
MTSIAETMNEKPFFPEGRKRPAKLCLALPFFDFMVSRQGHLLLFVLI